MTRTAEAVRRLRAADPVAGTALAPPAGLRRRQRRRLPRPALLVSATAALTAVALVLLPGGAGTPSDARAVDSLLAAGRAAAAAVDAPLGPGDRVYSRVQGTYLDGFTPAAGTSDAQPGLAVAWETSTDESWSAADGALVRRSVQGDTTYPTAADRQAVEQSGAVPPSGTVSVNSFPAPAGLSPQTLSYATARTLPTDPATLEGWIRDQTRGEGENADVEVWVAVQDMLLSPVAPPALRAALYQVAAGLPGVEYVGQVTDALGRTGTAVALTHGDDSHARGRMEMVFDENTGLLLERQEVALDPAQWGLPSSMRDAVVSRTLWEQSAVVPGDGVRPDGSTVALG